jgi:hypothetical protein
MATTKERVAERYPSLLPLLRHPEIGKLLTQAVTKNWSPGVFQSKFIASKWFRSQSEASRRWWVLTATDPGEAKLQRQAMTAEVQNLQRSLGASLSKDATKWVVESALQRGLPIDSALLRREIVSYGMRYTAPGTGHVLPQGLLRTTAKEIDSMARFQYALPGNSNWNRTRTQMVAMGELSMDDVENELREIAAKRFSHMKDDLAMGRSVADIVAPYAEIYASEMDIAPEEVIRSAFRNTDPKARELLGVRDPKTGKMRLPTEVEAMRLARSRADWWQTSSGRQNDASMSDMVTKAMGVRK